MNNEWITDRLPTAEDADYEGSVWVTSSVMGDEVLPSYWWTIKFGEPWTRTNRPKPYVNDVDRLKAINAELLEALEKADELIGVEPYEHTAQEAADDHRMIRAAIAKAKGEQL